jgi:hypothetical protein
MRLSLDRFLLNCFNGTRPGIRESRSWCPFWDSDSVPDGRLVAAHRAIVAANQRISGMPGRTPKLARRIVAALKSCQKLTPPTFLASRNIENFESS